MIGQYCDECHVREAKNEAIKDYGLIAYCDYCKSDVEKKDGDNQ